MRCLLLISLISCPIFSTAKQIEVAWTNGRGVSIDGNTIKNVTSQRAGAFSVYSLGSNDDGWVEMTVLGEENELLHFGFSPLDLDETHETIKYGISIGSSTFYSRNFTNTSSYGNHAIGDVFRVEKFGNQVLLKRNGTIFHTFVIGTAEELFIDSSINSYGKFFSTFASFGQTSGQSGEENCSIEQGGKLTWGNNVGIVVSANSLSKSSTSDSWDAGITSSEKLLSGEDGWVEFSIVNNGTLSFGFSTTDAQGQGPSSIKNALTLGSSTIYVDENYGAARTTVGYYQVEDVFKLERSGSYIYYYHNDIALFATEVNSADELLVDFSVRSPNAEINEIHASFGEVNPIVLAKNLNTNGKWISGSCDPNGLYVTSDGKVGINTQNVPGSFHFAVEGKVISEEVKVQLASNWPDFVFEKDYDLPSLDVVEKHIVEEGHLADIPSEEEVMENGIMLGEMDAKLLQKIEELTLYVIELNKQNKAQQREIELLKSKIED